MGYQWYHTRPCAALRVAALDGFVGSSCSLARYVWGFSQRLVPTAHNSEWILKHNFRSFSCFFQNLLSIRLRSRIEQKCNEKDFCTFRERSVWSHWESVHFAWLTSGPNWPSWESSQISWLRGGPKSDRLKKTLIFSDSQGAPTDLPEKVLLRTKLTF